MPRDAAPRRDPAGGDDRLTRSDRRDLLLVWLLLCLALAWAGWPDIAAGRFADPDDLMRLQQVRDWIAGQSWFDVDQHRIGGGLSMHWSRLVDVPLALVVAPLIPLIGRPAAEAVAVTAVPLLTLGIALCGVAIVARRMLPHRPAAVLLGCALAACAGPVAIQLHPTRIDHHGWQIALAALALAALCDRRARRSGLLAGLAVAVQLNVSLEGLPYATAIAAALGLGWATGVEPAARLTGFLAALAAGSLALLATVSPTGRFGLVWCDAILPSHVAALAIAAFGTAAAVRLLPPRAGPPVRLATLACVALAAAATLAVTAPACRAGPFGALDPLSARVWLDHVVEGLPVWRQPAGTWPTLALFPLVGLAGAIRAWRGASHAEARRRWWLAILLGIATLATGLLVRRAAGIAHIVAVPGALALLLPLLGRIAAGRSPAVRIGGSVAAILLLSPIAPAILGAMLADAPAPRPAAADPCDRECALAAIAALPRATMLTGIDLGPRLIAAMPHAAWTGGYHRSGRPMAETLRAFLSPPGTARRLMAARRLDYVLIEPDDGEADLYRTLAPHGLMAALVAGRVPGWLRPVPLPGHRLRLYRRLP